MSAIAAARPSRVARRPDFGRGKIWEVPPGPHRPRKPLRPLTEDERRMLGENWRIVLRVVKNVKRADYFGRWDDDFAQEVADRAAIRAAQTWDPDRGAKFTTYLWVCVRRDVCREMGRTREGHFMAGRCRQAGWDWQPGRWGRDRGKAVFATDGGAMKSDEEPVGDVPADEKAEQREQLRVLNGLCEKANKMWSGSGDAVRLKALGYTNAEIAEAWGVSASRVGELVRAARDFLQKWLREANREKTGREETTRGAGQ